MKKKLTVIAMVVTVVLINILYKEYQHMRANDTVYTEATDLMQAKQYTEALDKLATIEDEDYRDTAALIALSRAQIAYEKGNIVSAHYAIESMKFQHLSVEQKEKIESFRLQVEEEYDVHLTNMRLEKKKEEEEKLRNGVPFVGMSERDIDQTSLGSPSEKIRHNYECIGGEQYLANLYDFTDGEYTIFTARCVRGTVTEIWDHRESKVRSSSSYRTSKKKTEKTDQYNADQYSDPEDFYYDYYDDFESYEDAEWYWERVHD